MTPRSERTWPLVGAALTVQLAVVGPAAWCALLLLACQTHPLSGAMGLSCTGRLAAPGGALDHRAGQHPRR